MKTSLVRSGGVLPMSGVPSIRLLRSSIVAPWWTKCRSDPQIPHALTSTSSLPGAGAGIVDVVADVHPSVAQDR